MREGEGGVGYGGGMGARGRITGDLKGDKFKPTEPRTCQKHEKHGCPRKTMVHMGGLFILHVSCTNALNAFFLSRIECTENWDAQNDHHLGRQ